MTMSHTMHMKTLRKILLAALIAAILLLLPFLLPSAHAAQAKPRLNKTSADMVPGYQVQLKLKGASGPVVWKSSKKKTATVDENGLVTANKAGKCTIRATSGGRKYTCKIRVYDPGDVVNTQGAVHGIDVSVWQGNINFKKVKKDGIGLVIMRAGHGSSVDTTFKKNYKNAKKAGLMVGCYWFVTATSQNELTRQIRLCKKAIKGKTFDMPVFIDIESNSQFSKGRTFCSSLVSGFCDQMLSSGYTTGWYTSRSFVQKYLTKKVARSDKTTAWIAEHGPRLNYDQAYDIWQYSHTGRISGINAYVDLNWYFPNARNVTEG